MKVPSSFHTDFFEIRSISNILSSPSPIFLHFHHFRVELVRPFILPLQPGDESHPIFIITPGPEPLSKRSKSFNVALKFGISPMFLVFHLYSLAID
jgi:hypothetical protein